MNKVLLLAAMAFMPSLVSAQNKPAAPLFNNPVDSVSYAFGANIAADLKERGVDKLNTALLAKAMTDVFGNTDLKVSQEKSLELIQNFLRGLEKKKYEANMAEEKRFLEENKKKAGISVTPSGLQYEVVRAAEGASPKRSDKVTVHYRGTLANGAEFDSSYKRGEPISLGLEQVIPGWTEGLQLMSVGSKYRFYIPSELGYGERGGGDAIPPYSALIFEVELISIDAQ